MEVTLIAHTPDPERVVAAAARVCYADQLPEDILDGMDIEEAEGLIVKLIMMGHTSPLEHASFTFAVSGVSRALSHQLVRHRIASYSQRSQRFCGEGKFKYVAPPSIASNPAATEVFANAMIILADVYQALVAMGVSKEDARFVLPNACATQLVVTMNARALHNFFRERLCQRAQWEIREMATHMLTALLVVGPRLFMTAGPYCVTEGKCRQGTMSCGRI